MRTVAFILLPGVHLMDLSGPAQVFYEASQLGRVSIRLQYASVSGKVRTAQALDLAPSLNLEDLQLQNGDFLCVPGVDLARLQRGELDDVIDQLRTWFAAQQQKGVLLGSICSGALVLAELGLLQGRACTTHWKCMDYLEEQYPAVRVRRNRLYCFDRGVYTSAGMTSGIDMSLALIEQWTNPLLAAKVAQEMVINVRRPETSSQENTFLNFKNHFHPLVYRAQEMLSNDLRTEFTLADLSKHLHISSRQLARLFKQHTGQTIHAYRQQCRAERAEQLLRHSDLSINEIAQACGFAQVRQLIRLWKKTTGHTPGQWRHKYLTTPE